jgi:uncharacterized protein with PIN domain
VSEVNQAAKLRFVADCHLGKLARHLRFGGFDTLYDPRAEDGELLELARREGRLLLTRDRELAARGGPGVLLLHYVHLKEQLAELARALPLAERFAPFSRCMVCNTPLRTIAREEACCRVPPRVCESFDAFRRCPGCGRIYWRGDHYEAMIRRWERLPELEAAPSKHASEKVLPDG